MLSDEADFRALARGRQNLFSIIAKKLDIFSGTIFQDELKSSRVPTPGTAGGEKLKTVRPATG